MAWDLVSRPWLYYCDIYSNPMAASTPPTKAPTTPAPISGRSPDAAPVALAVVEAVPEAELAPALPVTVGAEVMVAMLPVAAATELPALLLEMADWTSDTISERRADAEASMDETSGPAAVTASDAREPARPV